MSIQKLTRSKWWVASERQTGRGLFVLFMSSQFSSSSTYYLLASIGFFFWSILAFLKLPKNYIARASYVPGYFNKAKYDTYDKPLMDLISEYNSGDKSAESKIKSLTKDFNNVKDSIKKSNSK